MQSKNSADQTQSGGKTILEIGYGAGGDGVATQYTAFVVHDSSGKNYLVTGDYAYPVADNRVLNQLTGTAVAPGATEGPWVSDAWLKAFRSGSALQFPSVANMGESLPSSLSSQPGTHVGDYGTLAAANGQQVGYIETADGLIEVDYFVYLLYSAGPAVSHSGAQKMTLTPSAVTAASPKDELQNPSSLSQAANDWPQNTVTPIDSDGVHPGFGVFCVSFAGDFDGDAPQLSMYYGSGLPQPLPAGAGVVQSGGSSFADVVLVRPGHAALARDVSGGESQNSGAEYLVTDTGTRYLMTPTAAIPARAAARRRRPLQPTSSNTTRCTRTRVDDWTRLVRRAPPSIRRSRARRRRSTGSEGWREPRRYAAGVAALLAVVGVSGIGSAGASFTSAVSLAVAGGGRTTVADDSSCTTKKDQAMPASDQSAKPWEISYANARAASGQATGAGVTVAIIDTGIAGGDEQLLPRTSSAARTSPTVAESTRWTSTATAAWSPRSSPRSRPARTVWSASPPESSF